LLRAAVAAMLNASIHEEQHDDIYGPGDIVYYPLYSSFEQCDARHDWDGSDEWCHENNVVDKVNEALAWPEGHDGKTKRMVMLLLAGELDGYNNGWEWIIWEDGPFAD
jgi:hypothetical protein